jgi:hypothetical protein
MDGSIRWPGGWRGAALILIGVLIGASVIQPALAHVTTRLAHLRSHLDPRYVNVGEALDAQDGFADSCDPNTTTYEDCLGAHATITLGKAGTALVIVTSHFQSEETNSAGSCRLELNDGALSGNIILQGPSAVDAGGLNLVDWVTLPAGTWTFEVACEESLGDIRFDDIRIAAVELQVD